jgi:NAD(P)-dependent dehydrogenase (short-subunit alcohol dehydrogenase family)
MPALPTQSSAPHAIVVGASQGAGLVCARQLASDGFRVSAIARHPPTARISRQIRFFPTDLRNSADIVKTLSEINKDGAPPNTLFFFQRFRGPGENWKGEIEVTIEATREIIEKLVYDHDFSNAAIVIVSSVNADLISPNLPLSYHIAKASLNQMVRFFAVALGSRGIRVNSISPGTFIKDESRSKVLSNKRLVQLYEKIIPLRRICTAEEVVSTARFLASPAASFVTGVDLRVDGGLTSVFQESLARHLVLDD